MNRVSGQDDVLVRLRAEARAIAGAGVEAVDAGRRLRPALEAWLAARPGRGGVRIVAAGKAAGAMMRAALAAGVMVERGLIASTHWDGEWPASIATVRAGHPIPTEASEAAGRAALDLAREAAADESLLVLLSGGASALLAAPAAGLTLPDKQAATKLLLDAGASIDELNAVRKHLSAVKGGGLAATARCEVVTFALSDVVGPVRDDPGVIGSGPTVPDRTTFADALAVLAKYRIDPPAAVRAHLETGAAGGVEETPKPGDPRMAHVETIVVATPQRSLDAAAAVARKRGIEVVMLGDNLEGEARVLGAEHATQAIAIAKRGNRPTVMLSGGETTVTVRGKGRGGRNVEYLLAEAIAANGRPDIWGLAADTDGVDGAEDIAGAIFTPDTLARARDVGRDPQTMLDDNDGHGFFERLGDSLITGPTRTNVNDFRATLIAP